MQNNDIFFLEFDVDTNAFSGPYFSYYNTAAKNIRFSVPSRGVVYTGSSHLRVLFTSNNPHDIRWDVNGVDSTVNMILWARDFSNTALTSGAIPNPLNLTGFHVNGFSQVILYNGVGGNPTLFQGDLVPIPKLDFKKTQGANTVSWVTSDQFYMPALQQVSSLGSALLSWQNVTNAVVSQGLTNTVTITPSESGNAFYRLKVLN